MSLTFDTSGIEFYVTENNPKTLNSLIKRLRAYYKDNPDIDPYRMAYALMPSQAASCPDAKQQYINGSAMPINSRSLQTGSGSSDISPFWMIPLKRLILR